MPTRSALASWTRLKPCERRADLLILRSLFAFKVLLSESKVTMLGYGVFAFCTSLTTLEFPESLTALGNMAFSHTEVLTSLDLRDVTYVGESAFEYSSGCDLDLDHGQKLFAPGNTVTNCSITAIKRWPARAPATSAPTQFTTAAAQTSVAETSAPESTVQPTVPPAAPTPCTDFWGGAADADGVRQLRHHFGTISHALFKRYATHARRVLYATLCPD